MILKPSTKSDELAEIRQFLDDPIFAGLPDRLRKAALAHKRGLEGEQYTSHILDRHFHNAPNHALIHDLRLPDGIGSFAQFDHIVLSRLSRTAAIFEVKNYTGRLSRNAHNEWMVWYDGRKRPVSIANPLAQADRQREVLREWLRANQHDKAFEQIGVFVIMPPGCDIDRKAVTTDFSVYKADNVISEWTPFGGVTVFGKLFSTGVSQGSLRAIGAQLAAAHVPNHKTIHERLGIAPLPQDTPNQDDPEVEAPPAIVPAPAQPTPEPPPVAPAEPESPKSTTLTEPPTAESAVPSKPRRKASEPETIAPGISQKILRDGRIAFAADRDNDEATAILAAACQERAKWNRQYRNWLCDIDAAQAVRAALHIDPLAGTSGVASGPTPEHLHVDQE